MISFSEILTALVWVIKKAFETLFSIDLILGGIHNTRVCLRWMFSAKFRKQMAEDRDYTRKMEAQLCVLLGGIVLFAVLVVSVYLLT